MVPVVDLARRGHALADAFGDAVQRIARRGTYLLGSETTAFESEFAHWCGAHHAIAVASGASALQLALSAAGVSPGDEVIVPAFTAVPTASAVCALGAVPVPVDVDHTAALDPDLVAAARTSRTSAVVVVHLYGRPAALPPTDLSIVVDAAQAHGAVRDHSQAAATVYSFYPTKNLGGIGDGGAVVTDRVDIADRVRLLRGHGMTEQYVHTVISQNFRISELEAAWLRLSLPGLRAGNERRAAIAAAYRSAAPHLSWHADHPDHVHHLCVLRATDRTACRATLDVRGIATAVHYPRAITQQPAYGHLARAECPVAESWAAECVTVPCFPELTDAEVEFVSAALATLEAR